MRITSSRTTAAAALGIVTVTLAACAGLPDTSFGAGGLKQLPGVTGYLAVLPLPDGKIMAATSGFDRNFVLRLNGNGTVDPSYANHGQLSVGFAFTGLGPDGRSFAIDVNTGRLSAYTAAGAPDRGFAGGAISVPGAGSNISGGVTSPAVSPAGDVYVTVCPARAPCRIDRYSHTGQRDTAFQFTAISPWEKVSNFGRDGSLFISNFTGSSARVVKLTRTGLPDRTFAAAGTLSLPALARLNATVVDPANKVLVQVDVWNSSMTVSSPLVFRYTARGTPDLTFGWLGMTSMPLNYDGGGGRGMTVDSTGRILATSTSGSAVRVYRYLPNGQLDLTFGDRGIATITTIKGVAIDGYGVVSMMTDGANRPIFGVDIGGAGAPYEPAAVIRLNAS